MKTDRLKLQRDALERIKELNEWEPGRKFTHCELLGISGNTVNALIRKGIIKGLDESPLKKYGLEYYYWTGKELNE